MEKVVFNGFDANLKQLNHVEKNQYCYRRAWLRC